MRAVAQWVGLGLCAFCAACNSRLPGDGDDSDGADLVCEDQDLSFGLALLRSDDGSVDIGIATDSNADGTIEESELEIQPSNLAADEFVGITLGKAPVALTTDALLWLDSGDVQPLADACSDCVENVAGPDAATGTDIVWLADAGGGEHRLLSTDRGDLWSGELEGDSFDVAAAATGEVYISMKDAGQILRVDADGAATVFYDASKFSPAKDVPLLESPSQIDYNGEVGLVVVGQGTLVNIYSLQDSDADGRISAPDELALEVSDGSATGPSLQHIGAVAKRILWRDRGNFSIDGTTVDGGPAVVLKADGLMGEDEPYGLLGLATPADPCILDE